MKNWTLCFWSILIFSPAYTLILLFWVPIFSLWDPKNFDCREIVVSHILNTCFCCEIHQCTRIRYILHSSQVMLWGRNRAERLPCFQVLSGYCCVCMGVVTVIECAIGGLRKCRKFGCRGPTF